MNRPTPPPDRIIPEHGGLGRFDGCIAGAFAGVVFVCFLFALLANVGCATCKPEVITTPEVVEIPVPAAGEELPVCRVALEVCHQPTITERVQCIGRNVADLIACHDSNVATIDAHNEGINAESPNEP